MSRQNASLHLVCVALTMSHLIIVTISVSSFSLPGCKGAASAAAPYAGVFVVCCGILLCLAVSPVRQALKPGPDAGLAVSGKTGFFAVCHGIHGGQGLEQQRGMPLSYIA